MIPRVKIAGVDISRLVVGANCFNGFSHISPARDAWLKKYFTVERILEVFEKAIECGLNATVTSPRERVLEAAKRTGGKIQIIGITGGNPEIDQQKRLIDIHADAGARFCLIHGGYTDAALSVQEKTIRGAEELLAYIRSKGMIPGISTHRPETITVADERGYDAELYIQPLNPLGHMSPCEVSWVANTIRTTAKPVIVIKPLAAGRVSPPHGLHFGFSNIKPADVVAVGVMSPEEIEEDATFAENLLVRGELRERLAYTPSKATMGVMSESERDAREQAR